MKQLLNSKKAQMTIATIVVTVLGGLLASSQVEMSEDVKLSLIKSIGWILAVVVGIYTASQGYADGKSGGKTSANYKTGVVESLGDFKEAMGAMGFVIKPERKRQARKAKDEPKPQVDSEATT